MTPIRAKSFGPLCVHPSWEYPQYFTVTHVATGYAVYSKFLSRQDAERAAKQMQRLKGWNFKTAKTGTKDLKRRDACRKIIAEVSA